jgi:hypothetical protein
VKGTEGSEVMILGEIYVVSLIFSYVTLCRLCAVRCLIIIGFYVLFYNFSTCFFNILCMFVMLFGIFVFYFAYFVFLCCFLYCFSICI